MKSTFGVLVLLALTAGAAAARQDKTPDSASAITGTWQMGLQADHVVPVGIVLKQDGSTVTGTILMPTHEGGRVEVPLKGEYAAPSLKLAGTVERAKEPTTIEITGTLQGDGTLEGSFEMHGRTIQWTAERLRDHK